MEKRTKIRHIAEISRSFSGFSPITETVNFPKYVILTNRFENFRRWPETVKISRREFERELHNNPVLVDVYLDNCSTEADFYLCEVTHDYTSYQYCIMCMKDQIVMLYYRKILMQVE